MMLVAVGERLTLSDPVVLLGLKFPEYEALKECGPALGLGIVNVASAEPFSGWLVAGAPSTLNDTFPVGVPEGDVTIKVTNPLVL